MAPLDDQYQRRRDDHTIPEWAVLMMNDMSTMRSDFSTRLARLEAGVAVIAFVITIGVAILGVLHVV